MPEGRRPRGVTPRLRSGAATESARLRQRRNGGEELPRFRGRAVGGCGLRGATPCLRSGAAAQRSYPASEVRGSNERSYPASKVRGSGREELARVRGWGGWLRGATPRPRSGVATRGIIPRVRGQGRQPGGATPRTHA